MALRDRAMSIMDYLGQPGDKQALNGRGQSTFPGNFPVNPPMAQAPAPGALAMPMPSAAPSIGREAIPQLLRKPALPDQGGDGGRMTPMVESGTAITMPPDIAKKAQIAANVTEQLKTNPMLDRDPSFQEKVKGFFGSRENMIRLAMGFNTMRLNPDAGLAASLGSELKDIRKTSKTNELRNKTIGYFESVSPKIAEAMRGGLSAKDAIALHREEGRVVGKMIINPRTGETIYDGTGEDSELPSVFRALQERAKAAGLIPGSPEYNQFMINGGQRTKGLAISVDKDGNIQISEGGAAIQKLNESQSNALTFGGRMKASGSILDQVEQQGTKLFEGIVQNIPIAGNYLLSPEYQSYAQAKRDFINAVLRKESGAAIAPSEFDNSDKQYFPQPGDTQQVIEQKRNNRELATKLMMAGVPIKGLTENPMSILKNIAPSIQKPEGVSQPIWDAMNDQEKLAFK